MAVSIKSPTATTGSIQLNGSDVLTIDSSGNLTAPNNLTVTGTVTQTGGATFNGGITGNVAFDTNTLYVDATNNRVGIGTSSPTEGQLVVRNDSGDAKLNIKVNSFDGTNGVAALDFSTGGQGANDPQARIHALGANNYSANIVFSTQQSGTTNPLAERMRIKNDGKVCINTTSGYGPSKLGVDFSGATNWGMTIDDTASSNSSAFIVFATGGALRGLITNVNNTSVAYNTTSDYRLKENVTPMSGSIERLKQLKPSTWTWIQNGFHGEGFVAHEAQTVVPEAVTGTKDAMRTENVYDENGEIKSTKEVPDYQGIDQSKLVPLLTSALQEAITKIEDLETRIQALENPNG